MIEPVFIIIPVVIALFFIVGSSGFVTGEYRCRECGGKFNAIIADFCDYDEITGKKRYSASLRCDKGHMYSLSSLGIIYPNRSSKEKLLAISFINYGHTNVLFF